MSEGGLCAAIHGARAGGRMALAGYLPGGYPDAGRYLQCVAAAAGSGLDILEIGIPAADPKLDGPVIRTALRTIREAGVDADRALALGSLAIQQTGCVGLAMFYPDSLAGYGAERLLTRCATLGIAGLLPVGLDLSAWLDLAGPARRHGIEMVGFVTPDMSEDTVETIARQAGGFLYVQSYPGITGQPLRFDAGLQTRLETVRRCARSVDLPVAVGFGVQTPADVARLRDMGVDAAIVGTALVEAAGRDPEAVSELVAGLTRQARYPEK